MKWNDFWTSALGAFFLYFSWSVLDAGRVLNRSGYSSMTRESHPTLFWLEVAAFAIFGLAALAYGLASIFGYSRIASQMDVVARRIPVLKFKVLLIFALLVLLLASFGWLVIEELVRTSGQRAGGG